MKTLPKRNFVKLRVISGIFALGCFSLLSGYVLADEQGVNEADSFIEYEISEAEGTNPNTFTYSIQYSEQYGFKPDGSDNTIWLDPDNPEDARAIEHYKEQNPKIPYVAPDFPENPTIVIPDVPQIPALPENTPFISTISENDDGSKFETKKYKDANGAFYNRNSISEAVAYPDHSFIKNVQKTGTRIWVATSSENGPYEIGQNDATGYKYMIYNNPNGNLMVENYGGKEGGLAIIKDASGNPIDSIDYAPSSGYDIPLSRYISQDRK